MFRKSTGPAHLYGIDFDCRAEAEVHPQIVLRNITGAASHFIHQGPLASLDCDLCADPVAIGVDSDCLKGNPVVAVMHRIHQEAGTCIHVVDDYGKSPIVPQIGDRQTSRRRNRVNPWSGRGCHVRERSVAVVMVKESGLHVAAAQVELIYFWIDMSVRSEEHTSELQSLRHL